MLRTRNGPLILWLTPLGLALAGLVLTATYSPAVVATAFQPGNLVVSRSVYQDVLHRPAATSEVQYWVSFIG